MAFNMSKSGKSKQNPPIGTKKPVTKQALPTALKSRSSSADTELDHSDDSFLIENYVLFWLDPNINPNNDYYMNTIKFLQTVVKTIHIFNNGDECIRFLNDAKDQKVLMMLSGAVARQIIPRIHNIPQLNAIFIFCENKAKYEPLKENRPKVQGVFTDIKLLSESLKKTAYQFNEDPLSISIFSTNDSATPNLNKLEPSFMYTQLIQEILVELEYNEHSLKDFTDFCRTQYPRNTKELEKIEEFEIYYQANKQKSAIKWYTSDSFLYKMLNNALCEQKTLVVVKMGFFITDLLEEIKQLYMKQSLRSRDQFIVYRGQIISSEMFTKMKQSKHGLISFNNFLSTSTEEDIGVSFAKGPSNHDNPVRILFKIEINPMTSSVPFADIQQISEYANEYEVLFSMLAVFRIVDIKPRNTDKSLWDVYLKSTDNKDDQLHALIERMREEIEGPSAWYRLGALMMKLCEFKKAEELFETALSKCTTSEVDKGNIYYQFGQIKDHQKDYRESLQYYDDALKIYQKNLREDHPNIATCYNNMGLVHDNMNDYKEALTFYEKAYEIYKKTLPNDHPNLATCCNSIAMAYNSLNKYEEALKYCEIAKNICSKTLIQNHPLLATLSNNIGLIYANTKNYPKAVAAYKRAIEIGQAALPPDHPHLLAYKQNLDSIQKKNK